MKISRFFIGGVVSVLILSALVFAQTEKPQTSNVNKIALINTEAFYNKETGIKEIVETNDKLESEFRPIVDELNSLYEKYNAMVEEIKKLQPPSAPYFYYCFSPLSEKIKELEKLEVKIKKKQEEAKKNYEARKPEIFADVYKKVGDAIQQFAKEKGY